MNHNLKNQTLFKKIFCDASGKVVVFQTPNLPIVLFVFASIAASITNDIELLSKVFSLISAGLLFIWGWLEVTQGVNYFRRFIGILGVIGSSGVVYSALFI